MSTPNPLPPVTFDVYRGKDGVMVIHVDTPGLPCTEQGPVCRVYLNDGEAIWANPDLPAPLTDEL